MLSIIDFDTFVNFGYHSRLGRGSRTNEILAEIRKEGGVSVDVLVKRLRVSPATARRELVHMEQRGLLKRQRGRAVPVEPAIYSAYSHDSAFQEQVSRMVAVVLGLAERPTPDDAADALAVAIWAAHSALGSNGNGARNAVGAAVRDRASVEPMATERTPYEIAVRDALARERRNGA